MSDDTDFWNDCYTDGKTGWDRGDVHPALLHWIENKSLKPCDIIVPGCGRGYEVVELAERNFNVTAIDFASEPVHDLRSKLSQHKTNSQVVQESIFDFQPNEPVDAVYEQTCLCAIKPAQRSHYEETIFKWLKPGGKLFVLFAQVDNPGESPPHHCGLEEMKNLFPESRWQWLTKDEPVTFNHPSGRLFEFAKLLERKDTNHDC